MIIHVYKRVQQVLPYPQLSGTFSAITEGWSRVTPERYREGFGMHWIPMTMGVRMLPEVTVRTTSSCEDCFMGHGSHLSG